MEKLERISLRSRAVNIIGNLVNYMCDLCTEIKLLPHMHAQGVKPVSIKIDRSGDLGIIAKFNYDYSVGKVENLPPFAF